MLKEKDQTYNKALQNKVELNASEDSLTVQQENIIIEKMIIKIDLFTRRKLYNCISL